MSAATAARMAAFNPNKLGNLGLWLHAGRITGLNDGDAVATLPDVSGFSRNATQATGGLQPLYKPTAIGGKPAVRFDGVDDKLATASWGTFTQPNTIFVVASIEQPTLTGGWLYDGIGTGNRHSLFVNGAAPYTRSMYSGVTIVGANDDLPQAAAVFTTIHNTTASETYKNGTLHASGSTGAHTLTGLSLGARFNGVESLKGDVAEVLIVRRAMSASDRLQTERWLAVKYGITTA